MFVNLRLDCPAVESEVDQLRRRVWPDGGPTVTLPPTTVAVSALADSAGFIGGDGAAMFKNGKAPR